MVRVKIVEVDSDDSWSSDEETTKTTRGRKVPLEEVAPAEESGLSHSGGPEAEMEEAIGQPVGAGYSIGPVSHGEAGQAQREGKGPRILRAPKAPTQKEIYEHVATHLPHQPWCEVCMMGRGRNSPHRRKKEERKETERGVQLSLPVGKREDAPEEPTEAMADRILGSAFVTAPLDPTICFRAREGAPEELSEPWCSHSGLRLLLPPHDLFPCERCVRGAI